MGGVGLAHDAGKGTAEPDDEHEKDERGERRDAPCGGEQTPFGRDDIAPGLVGLGGETEITGLHSHGQQRERQRDEGIDIGDDTVGLLPEDTGIVRREQIAQKPHHDGADAVDGRLFRQFFEHGKRLTWQR